MTVAEARSAWKFRAGDKRRSLIEEGREENAHTAIMRASAGEPLMNELTGTLGVRGGDPRGSDTPQVSPGHVELTMVRWAAVT